jgi:hypothetical protein
MTERDKRIIEAMIGEADDWHIVDPDTGAEIDQDGGIPVTPGQFKSLLAGESAVVGLTRRVVTLADGPFSIQRGGKGSGHFGHAGIPGHQGGSLPSGEVAEEAVATATVTRRMGTTRKGTRFQFGPRADALDVGFTQEDVQVTIDVAKEVLEESRGSPPFSQAWVSPDGEIYNVEVIHEDTAGRLFGALKKDPDPARQALWQRYLDANDQFQYQVLLSLGWMRIAGSSATMSGVNVMWSPTEPQKAVLDALALDVESRGGELAWDIVGTNTGGMDVDSLRSELLGYRSLTVRGGKGSGYTKAKGHKGRPGEVGGSEPSATGPEEHKPVRSKRKGKTTTQQARIGAFRMLDLLETFLEEAQAGNSADVASWKYLSALANRNARSMEAGGGEESVPLVESQQTNLWVVYHGIQHILNTTDLRDGLDEEENASIRAVGDLLGDFEPEVTGRQPYGAALESGLGQGPTELLRSYVGDDSTPGYLPEEVTRDPYMRYETGRIIANFAASMEGSYLTDYNGTDESYLDISRMMAERDEAVGGMGSDPEAWNAVVEVWRQRAVSNEDTSESALAMREAPEDPNFWAQNQAMTLSFGQWLPTDVTPDLYETANILNAGWMADPQHSAGGVALEEAAVRIFGGTAPGRESLRQAPGAASAVEVSLLDGPQTQDQANHIIQGMYDGTQAWLADRGYHPGDTVRLYRGLGNIEGDWNPLRGPGEGNLQMFAVSSWSFEHSEAEAFTTAGATVRQTTKGAVVAADIPIERLLANSDTGVPCEREGEWLVLGMDGIRGRVYRESDPPLAWQYDIDPTLSPQQVRAQVGQIITRSAVCLGFLPVSLPAQVITAQGWREIAARQATAPDPSLPIINVEADGDWIGNKLGVYGLTRADVDGMAQPETGKEPAQKGQETGKPGDEEKPKGEEGGAPNKEAGLRAYARAKRANRVRRERARAAGRQRLQSGEPPVVERGGEGSGHFGHEGRPGEVGGSLPSGQVSEEARPGGKRIVKVLSVKDTREYDDSSGKWAPITGSGIEHYCDRCGKLHEILATVQLEDGDEIVVGTSCAHAEFSEAVRRQMQSKERAARRLRQLEAEAASKKAAQEAWDVGFAEVSTLPMPEIVVTPEVSERGYERLRVTMGDATQYTFQRTVPETVRNGVVFNWRANRLRERGFQHDRPHYDAAYYEREIAKVTERLNRDLVARGGPGSGFKGHAGRPGEVGGSLPSGEVTEEAVPMQVAELPLSANINRPGSAREFIRRRMQERLGKDVTSGHGEIMELYDSVRQKAPSMLWFREPGGAVLAVGVADAGSYGWPPTKIALGGLFAKPEGTGLGTAFMEALRDYADAAHKEIEVWAVANQRFFNRFGWLTPDKGNYPSSYYYMSPGRLADREGYEPHWMEQARQEGRYHGE